ncbi:MAG: hypothetical protein DCC67_17355, partial [Planctomycetota bacterium]
GRLRATGYADVAGQVIDPLNAYTTRFKYDAQGRVRESVDPLGRFTRFEYDRQGKIIKQTSADGTEVRHDYDRFGNRIATTDELGRTTRFVYDGRNRLIETIRADGASARVRYDGAGNVVATTDALGAVTTSKYDAAGRLLETKLPDPLTGKTTATSPTTSNKYDKLGNLIETIDPKGHSTQFFHDRLGRVVQTQTLKGAIGDRTSASRTPVTTLVALSTTDYDAAGNVWQAATYDVSQYDAAATSTLLASPRDEITAANKTSGKVQAVSSRYDAFGRPRTVVVAEGSPVQGATHTEYDAAGRIRFQYDEANSVTEFIYDTASDARTGRLLQTKLPDPTTGLITADSPTTTYQYDAAGNRTAVTDSRGFTTRFEYDVFNRVVASTDPRGGRSRNVYDVAGQMIAAIDELGRSTHARYDQSGRVVLRRSADPDAAGLSLAPTTRFKYDMASRLVEEIDELGYSTLYEYDHLGRVTKRSTVHAEVVDDTDPGFAIVAGNLASHPNAARGYANSETLLAPIDGSSQARATWTFTAVEAGSYVAFGTWSVAASASTTATLRVTHNGIESVSQHDLTTPVDAVYRFDEPDPRGWRLLTNLADLPANSTIAFEFTGDVGKAVYADALRLEKLVSTSFAYDANGNMLAETDPLGRVTSYTYDELDRVVTMTLPDPDDGGSLPSPRTTRTYDGYGNLARSAERNGTSGASPAEDDTATAYQYDARNRLTAETLDAGADSADVNYVNKRTTYQYDAAGNLLYQREYAENAIAAGTFDLLRTTAWQYDKLGRRTRETFNSDLNDAQIAPDEQATETLYDQAGNVTLVQQLTPAGGPTHSTAYQYDGLNRLVLETESGSSASDTSSTQTRVTQFQYDAVGNLISTTDPLGRVSRSEYDRLDRLTKSIALDVDGSGPQSPEFTAFTHDAAGQVLTKTNAAGDRVLYAYDPRGLLVRTDRVRDPAGQLVDTTLRSYDDAGNLVRLTDPADSAIDYQYDQLDRVTTETDAAGKSRLYKYNAAGQLFVTTDKNGQAIRRQYDRLGRPALEMWFSAANAHRADDPSPASNDETLRYAYDGAGRLSGIDYELSRRSAAWLPAWPSSPSPTATTTGAASTPRTSIGTSPAAWTSRSPTPTTPPGS